MGLAPRRPSAATVPRGGARNAVVRLSSLLVTAAGGAVALGRLPPAYPTLLPRWAPSYAMADSTIAMASNSLGFFNASLAARFGVVAFDHNNAFVLWDKHIHPGHMPTGTTSEEYLVQQCALVKQANNRTKCFVYRNGEVSISWLSSEAKKMYTKADASLFLQAGGRPYNEPGDGDPHVHIPNKDQFFFNFSNPAMASWWNDTLMLGPHAVSGSAQTRCCGAVVDGIFVDDSTGLGTEHTPMVRRCGMGTAAIADWNAKAHAAYVASWRAVVDRGGFVWNLLRDPDGRFALTGGVPPQPTNGTCAGYLRAKCGNSSWGGQRWAMMMSPEPGSERQAVAAFMLLRGPYAWLGRGWLGGDVDESLVAPDLHSLDPGTPLGPCKPSDGSGEVYTRQFTRMTVSLNCSSWMATFEPSRGA